MGYPRESLIAIRLCLRKPGVWPVAGSHASILLRPNIKRVNNTLESICASVLVNDIHFFKQCVQVCVVKNKSACDKTLNRKNLLNNLMDSKVIKTTEG